MRHPTRADLERVYGQAVKAVGYRQNGSLENLQGYRRKVSGVFHRMLKRQGFYVEGA